MADDAHQATPLPEFLQGAERQIEGLLVQAAEALVHEDRVEPDSSGMALDHIGEAQGERQGGLEAFTP